MNDHQTWWKEPALAPAPGRTELAFREALPGEQATHYYHMRLGTIFSGEALEELHIRDCVKGMVLA